jgi:hypothetical protein
MSHDPTLSAFLRLRAFSDDEAMSPLDRLSTGTAAAWLAHATSYGITADSALLRDIADPERHPVARAKTLTLAIVESMSAAGLPMSAPFQSVDVLYSAIEDDGYVGTARQPANPLERAMTQGPRP